MTNQLTTRNVGTAALKLVSRWVGETPRGTIVDVQVGTGATLAFGTSVTGALLSWSDWLVIRKDMVAESDGRGVVKLGDALVGFTFVGTVDYANDLVNATDEQALREQRYRDWRATRAPFSDSVDVHLSLAIRFLGGGQAPDWASERFKKTLPPNTAFLFRSQFIFTGNVKLVRGDIKDATLTIWEVT